MNSPPIKTQFTNKIERLLGCEPKELPGLDKLNNPELENLYQRILAKITKSIIGNAL